MELKPCPFCGSNNIEILWEDRVFWTECDEDCGGRGALAYRADNAISLWNTRITS